MLLQGQGQVQAQLQEAVKGERGGDRRAENTENQYTTAECKPAPGAGMHSKEAGRFTKPAPGAGMDSRDAGKIKTRPWGGF